MQQVFPLHDTNIVQMKVKVRYNLSVSSLELPEYDWTRRRTALRNPTLKCYHSTTAIYPATLAGCSNSVVFLNSGCAYQGRKAPSTKQLGGEERFMSFQKAWTQNETRIVSSGITWRAKSILYKNNNYTTSSPIEIVYWLYSYWLYAMKISLRTIKGLRPFFWDPKYLGVFRWKFIKWQRLTSWLSRWNQAR